MFGFRASILALDTYAEFFVDRHRLKVIHSKCGGKIMQKAANDTSNFREHVSVCQGPHSSTNDDSFLKGSLRCGPGPSTHPSMVARPGRLLCPGFSFDRLFGRDYGSLLNHEREQVTRAAKVAGLVWLDSREKSSIISTSCLRNSPSHQGPAQACRNCTKVLELSNFKHTLCRKTSKSNHDRFTPFRAIDSKAIAAYEDRKPTNVSQSPSKPYPTFVDKAFLGEDLVPTAHTLPSTGLGVVIINTTLAL